MNPERKWIVRQRGRGTEALLRLLKQLTSQLRWVFAALLALYSISGIHTVRPNEQALVIRFGRLQPDLHGPGLLVGLPAPFERILSFETGREATRVLDQWAISGAKLAGPERPPAVTPDAALEALGIPGPGGGEPGNPLPGMSGGSLDPVLHGYTLSRDFNLVQGRFMLRYRISDPFRFTLCGNEAEPILDRLTYHALAGQIGARRIDASLTSDRQAIAMQAALEVQQDADRLELGVSISGLDILELSPPSQVLAAFEEVVTARQSAKTLLETSRQYEAESLARIRGEASSLLLKTQSEAAGRISQAQGEASSFLAMMAQYRLNPELVSRRLLRETVDTVMTRVQSRSFIPHEGPQPSLIVEPLPVESQ